ncbi:MAG: uracil-DNA glycosylase [Bacteroidota bacterium]|nr:uracil-DNA glycosylase [Bacteroidota bacterium]
MNDEFEQKYFKELTQKVKELYLNNTDKIFPKGADIFRAFDLCPFDQAKVIILGQDPYPTRGHAHGLSFSVNDHVKPFPKSLKNIFSEINNDIGKPFPENGNLSRWAEQGVLLLNAVLTVEEGRPDSHKGIGWEQFTDSVIKVLSTQKEHLIFMLWGAKAGHKRALIDEGKHKVLSSVHPSPLSAYRGFFGCKHFSKANDYLLMNKLTPIDW